MKFPGFLTVLQDQLQALSVEDLERANRTGGLEISDLLGFITSPRDYTVDRPYIVETSSLETVCESSDDYWCGRQSLTDGETAFCLLVEKNSFTARDDGSSLLEEVLMKSSWVKFVWLLVSPEDKKHVENCVSSVGSRAHVLTNYESLCLTPSNELLLVDNTPVFHSCGGGDLLSVLTVTGLSQEFIESGGRYVLVARCDHVECLAPSLIGMHIKQNKPVTWEVSPRSLDSSKGIFCEHDGFPQVVEKFRLSAHTEDDLYELNSTDNCVFNADLDFKTIDWKWHRIKVLSNSKLSIQYKRSLYDLTATFQTQFVKRHDTTPLPLLTHSRRSLAVGMEDSRGLHAPQLHHTGSNGEGVAQPLR